MAEIAEADQGSRAGPARSNAFDFVRLTAAVLVVVEHSWVLAGHPAPLPSASGSSFGQIGVGMFFAISGYLVSSSWLRDPSTKRFLVRRALRIYPAFFIVILLLSLAIGPALSELPAVVYFTSSQTWSFLIHNLAILPMRYDLPGVFLHLPYSAVNGSLWSIRFEILCYIGIVVLGSLGLLRHRNVLVGCAACALAFIIVFDLTGYAGALPHWFVEGAAEPIAFFTLGMLARKLSADGRAPWWITVLGGSVWAVTWGTWLAHAGSIVAIAAATFTLAFSAPHWLHHPTRTFDLSYGTYVLAFPVQQFLVQIGLRNSPLITVTTLGIVLPLAALSWRFVERPALRFKPGRAVSVASLP